MSETKWTPGPYERSGTTVYALNGRGVNRITAQVQAGWKQKAFVRESPDDQRTSEEECEATAQLFTAASELYEALEGMVQPWDGFSEFEMRRRVDEPRADAIMMARTALAKARGETQ